MSQRQLVTMLALGHLSLSSAVAWGQTATEEDSLYGITHITGDLYRFRHITEYSVFLVTPEGIILVDPLAEVDFKAPEWLKGQLAERFGVPVRYVIYSHYHIDRAAGAEVFADTAEIIAHENTPEKLEPPAEDQPLTPDFSGMDKDGDGTLSLAETANTPLAPPRFTRWDTNADEHLTGAELAGALVLGVRAPDTLYKDRMTLELGGKRIELLHPGESHSDDTTVVYFPEERAVFVSGVMRAFTGLPGGYFSGRPMSAWINSFKAIEALDFDLFVPGDGPMGSKADVMLTRRAWEDLHEAVAEGIAQGKSLDELKRTLRLDDYQHYPGYEERLPDSINEAYRAIMAHERQ